MLPEFLPFLVQSDGFFAHALGTSAGSLSPRTNWTDLSDFEFDLPPLDEQKRLADLLWRMEEHREALRISENALNAAVESALDIAWLDEANLRAIGSFAAGITGCTPSKANAAYWNTKDVPFYTPSEISGLTLQKARQQVSSAGAAVGRILPRFSVAVACIGGDMGKSAIVDEPGITNQQITAIVGLPEPDAYLLQALLSHPMGRTAMESRETTTIVRKLNKSDLLKVQVPWPKDRNSLRQIIGGGQQGRQAISYAISAVRTLHQALLDEVFGDCQ